MKMKKTDIGVVVFMYLVCGFFYYHMTKLKASSQTYPRFTIILLFGLTTLYLVQMIVAARKYGVESGVDEVFKDFQPKQFFVCLCATILYLPGIVGNILPCRNSEPVAVSWHEVVEIA